MSSATAHPYGGRTRPARDRRLRVTLVTERLDLLDMLSDQFAVRAVRFSDAQAAPHSGESDIVLIDACDGDRMSVVSRMSRAGSQSVVVLGPPGSPTLAMRYLDAGAADYVPSTTTPVETAARLRAMARHVARSPVGRRDADFVIGNLRISLSRQEVLKDDTPVSLTPNEFRLLEALLSSPNEVVRHRDLIARVWSAEQLSARHYLRVYIRQLREKLEDDPQLPALILTQWGHGYEITTLPARTRASA